MIEYPHAFVSAQLSGSSVGKNENEFSFCPSLALVAQWIVQTRPKGTISVRFRTRALNSKKLLEPVLVEADYQFIAYRDDGDAHLAAFLDHLLTLRKVGRNIVVREWYLVLGEKILRRVAKVARGGRVNGDLRFCYHRWIYWFVINYCSRIISRRLFCISRRLQGTTPPDKLIDKAIHPLRVRSEHIGDRCSFPYRHDDIIGHVDSIPDGGHLEFDGDFSKLLDGTGTHGAPVRHERDRLVVPLLVCVVERVLEDCGVTVIVFGRDDDERVGFRDLRGPLDYRRICIGFRLVAGRLCLVEERHRVIAEVQDFCVYTRLPLQPSKYPRTGLIAETALTRRTENNFYFECV